MKNIDEIMDMLDWHNSSETQCEGRELAKTVKCINVFLQPGHLEHNKNVWDNCAMILADKSDMELRPYLHELFEWLVDMNWPGAYCIFDRLCQYEDGDWFDYVFELCIKEAKALKNDIWLNNLEELIQTMKK